MFFFDGTGGVSPYSHCQLAMDVSSSSSVSSHWQQGGRAQTEAWQLWPGHHPVEASTAAERTYLPRRRRASRQQKWERKGTKAAAAAALPSREEERRRTGNGDDGMISGVLPRQRKRARPFRGSAAPAAEPPTAPPCCAVTCDERKGLGRSHRTREAGARSFHPIPSRHPSHQILLSRVVAS